MSLLRQHLIDPEICIRCNTCEETCPVDAITHDDNNYVVDAAKCDYCMDCISPCPTGSIDNWRMVTAGYSIEAQFSWGELPAEIDHGDAASVDSQQQEANEEDASEILKVAHSGESGKVLPPASAERPYINIYNRDKPMTARVAGNFRLTDDNSESDIRHVILDFGDKTFPVLEGQSIGIIPPGEDEKGRPHLVRLYSVASPRDGERPGANNLALTVKRVVFQEDGETVRGIGSNYVCDLKKGDQVLVTGPFGATFLMPNTTSANLIMICTGTGSAPFRAMTEYRRRHMPDAGGKLLLYFGARTPGELPYFGPLNKLSDRFIDKQLVFSRLPDNPKEYVQNRMINQADKLAALLNSQDTYIYICGLKEMEKGVEEAFEKICADNNLSWTETKITMKSSGRYHVETY
ncbi:benzoyl-CoA 2,3-epoxidase subunit BoxA [Sedimenticola selenatireducens]|uniref:Benzoyl-CoA 2,3-epoxidase subunit BoxA n=1 Tax=Sedimenticola selenatireducens TaxID=191960 RepID=A0A557SM67_9GAMM|nr:benzoyl-CoA 2,3-epoxidase subunit BoxA [Sedimenticola selenatireducens]TVO78504.1 benzoyl-CoA 2,3-epoxidase subunit BoxA [Sedimenticola selenatireducens]TVT62706.1 MAG: benzoyl-CoA 2,3-epoxidase subunit BoxA [Sedimenticola selenatireducens]